VIAICGTISRRGSIQPEKWARFSIVRTAVR
jgi:hypothetical protein